MKQAPDRGELVVTGALLLALVIEIVNLTLFATHAELFSSEH